MKKHHDSKKIDISKIIVDPFNPPIRTENKFKIQELSRDIRKNGLLDEIKVRKPFKSEKKGHYYVFDGHRRLQAIKELRENSIDCSVYTLKNKAEAESIYNSINTLSMKMDSSQYAWRWLKGCTIPQKHLTDIKILSNWFGSCGDKFKKHVMLYCTKTASPRQHNLTVATYLEYFKRNEGEDDPSHKQILEASFKNPTVRSWKNFLFGKKEQKPLTRKRIIDQILGY